jgi:hypothetical protein
VMLGEVTVKLIELLQALPTVTGPVVAPAGTGTLISVEVELVGAPVTPLKSTNPPRLVPEIDTDVPTRPDIGEISDMFAGATLKAIANGSLATPPTVTTIVPVVVPSGTVVTILVAPQLETVAKNPSKVTVLVPWLEPKFAPEIVTGVPTLAQSGETLPIPGPGEVTVKLTPLLVGPKLTVTRPVVAPTGTGTINSVSAELVAPVATPGANKMLGLCQPPPVRLVPVIVICAPTVPEVGEMLLITGGGLTSKATLLLATPATETTTFPLVAPTGTVTPIEVRVQ